MQWDRCARWTGSLGHKRRVLRRHDGGFFGVRVADELAGMF